MSRLKLVLARICPTREAVGAALDPPQSARTCSGPGTVSGKRAKECCASRYCERLPPEPPAGSACEPCIVNVIFCCRLPGKTTARSKAAPPKRCEASHAERRPLSCLSQLQTMSWIPAASVQCAAVFLALSFVSFFFP